MFFEALFVFGISCLILAFIIEKTTPCCEANASNIPCSCKENEAY